MIPKVLSRIRFAIMNPYVLLTGCVLVVFFNTLRGSFVFDDEQFIVRNIYLTDWKFLPRLLTENLVAGAGVESNLYRPLQSLTHFIDFRLWGLSPFGHHLTNLWLHLAASLAVLAFLRSLFSKWTAFFFAAFFCLHPLQSEAVAYLSGRNDTLAIFFLCAGLLAFRRYLLLSLICQGLALMSKESMMLYPVFLALYLGMKGEKPDWKKHVPFWLVSAGYFGLRLTVLNFSNTLNFYKGHNFFTDHFLYRFYTYLTTLPKGVLLWLAPYDLHHERSWPVFVDPLSWQVLTGFLFAVFCVVLMWRMRHRRPRIFCGILWFLAGTFPTSNLAVIINAIFYDHWFILPGLGLVMVLADLAESVPGTAGTGCYNLSRNVPGTICGLSILILGIFSSLTIQINRYWLTPLSLNQHILQWEPRSAKICNNYAMALADQGKKKEAIEYYKKGISLSDEYPQTHHNLAMVYRDLGRLPEALEELDKAIRMSPDFYHSWLHKGLILMQLGRLSEAEAAFKQAKSIYTLDESIYLALSQLYLNLGKPGDAYRILDQGAEAIPASERLKASIQEIRRRFGL